MSGIDIAKSIFVALNIPSVLSLLDGGRVYLFNRPINSPNKDVIIDVISDKEVNVNIHAPNLETHGDQTIPDLASFDLISKSIMDIIGVADNTALPIRDKDGHWYTKIVLPVEENLTTVELINVTHIDDGYGGFTPNYDVHWAGLAYKTNISRGPQVNVEAGVYRLNEQATWILPESANPEKNMTLLSDYGDYVINGIVPSWVISTVRKDG